LTISFTQAQQRYKL